MKNQYRIIKIDATTTMNMDEFRERVRTASHHYANGLDEVREYCGSKIFRHRCGWSAVNGKYEFIIERI